jgi:hypothetical protein
MPANSPEKFRFERASADSGCDVLVADRTPLAGGLRDRSSKLTLASFLGLPGVDPAQTFAPLGGRRRTGTDRMG